MTEACRETAWPPRRARQPGAGPAMELTSCVALHVLLVFRLPLFLFYTWRRREDER